VRSSCAAPAGEASLGGEGCLDAREQLRAGRRHGLHRRADSRPPPRQLAGREWEQWFGSNPGLLLTGGIAALIYAYLVRFLAVALHTVESSLGKITPNMDDAARGLGLGQGATLRRVHAPMLRGSLFTAGLLVFVDVMKELPATLVMRPFNFDTLVTQAYTLASDERLAEAATASLAIVAVGLLPLIALSRQISRARN